MVEAISIVVAVGSFFLLLSMEFFHLCMSVFSVFVE